jgi:hypothetical protein
VVRVVVVITLVCGCGRLGFDGDDGPNGPGFCAQAAFTNPGTSSLTDDFTVEPFTDRWFPVATCVTQIGGELVAAPPDGSSYCHAWTLGDHHLTCDSVTVRVGETLAPVLRAQTFLYINSTPDGAQLSVILEAGGFQLLEMGVPTPYDPVADLWWRLAEYDGELYFKTSADGINFVERARVPTPIPLDHVEIAIGAGTYTGAVPDPGAARFRCYNLPPPCT